MKTLIFSLPPSQAVSEVFDGHPSIDEAIDYWADMPTGAVAFGPHGFEFDYETVMALVPWARLVSAAKSVLECNTGDLDTDSRSGCFLIGQPELRALRAALNNRA